MSKQHVILKIISTAVLAVEKAGKEIRRIYKDGKLDVISKSLNDYQTEADRLSQMIIIGNLRSRFTKCDIIGEEDGCSSKSYSANQDHYLLSENEYDKDILSSECPTEFEHIQEADITIWVDPLDGTAEFVSGKPDSVTVLVGLTVNKRSVAGVIHHPFHNFKNNESVDILRGRTVWSLKGLGCYGIEPINLPSDNGLVVTTSSSHGNATNNAAIEAIQPGLILRIGGSGNKVVSIIEGKAHCYVFASNGTKKWDTCAAEAVLECCGGRMTDLIGDSILYERATNGNYSNNRGVLASVNQTIHKQIVEKIPEEIKKSLLQC